ncbi:hypothetical protein [Legionella sp. CNM-4043-24]|uniref:hypothetical protein n=1 Tax=Legionella sp. CNM-4043-24 TaxID=3421646 RepID=UPI00403AC909
MLKQGLVYLLVSILVVVFAQYLHIVFAWVDQFYHYIDSLLSPIFNKGGIGNIICRVILLTIIPVLLAAVPALLWRLIKGSDMPHFIALTWGLWLVIVLSNIVIR